MLLYPCLHSQSLVTHSKGWRNPHQSALNTDSLIQDAQEINTRGGETKLIFLCVDGALLCSVGQPQGSQEPQLMGTGRVPGLSMKPSQCKDSCTLGPKYKATIKAPLNY